MRAHTRLQKIMALWVAVFLWGCTLPPPSPATPALSATAAQQTIDRWNVAYCKVVEFYGFHQEGSGDTQVAYVLLANPADPATKPMVYEARFYLLTRPDGTRQWFLTSLVSHSGGLSRRQGWDNLFIPVKGEASSG